MKIVVRDQGSVFRDGYSPGPSMFSFLVVPGRTCRVI